MILIQHQDFDPATEYHALQNSGTGAGALATFTGLVRNSGDLEGVRGLFLEHYPGMTEKVIAKLIRQAAERWDVQQARVIHRVGHLALGEQIVFVGVCSTHRGDAFAACEFIMDELKTSAPFWKKEITGDYEHWVEQKSADLDRSEHWKESPLRTDNPSYSSSAEPSCRSSQQFLFLSVLHATASKGRVAALAPAAAAMTRRSPASNWRCSSGTRATG